MRKACGLKYVLNLKILIYSEARLFLVTFSPKKFQWLIDRRGGQIESVSNLKLDFL